jgi:hypothetical protein
VPAAASAAVAVAESRWGVGGRALHLVVDVVGIVPAGAAVLVPSRRREHRASGWRWLARG